MATTLTLSERNREQFRRFVRLNYDSCIKRGLETNSDRLLDGSEERLSDGRFGKFDIELYVMLVSDCDDQCDCADCVSNRNREFTLSIRYRSNKEVCLRHYDFRIEDTTMSMVPKILQWIDELPSTYELCRCKGTLALRDGWCHACYLYRYTRTEEEGGDCCVCLENEGRWIKLSCNHIIHGSCYTSINDRKCPLCRQLVGSSYSFDPYD